MARIANVSNLLDIPGIIISAPFVPLQTYVGGNYLGSFKRQLGAPVIMLDTFACPTYC